MVRLVHEEEGGGLGRKLGDRLGTLGSSNLYEFLENSEQPFSPRPTFGKLCCELFQNFMTKMTVFITKNLQHLPQK